MIEAVSGGQADIGFVAYEPSRAGTVEFSQTYMLVQQSFLVLDGSSIRAIADIDRAGQKIAGTRNNSITLFMKRKLKQATLVEIENNPAEIKRMLHGKEIDAFGANRQRLTTLMKDTPGTRLLPDNLFGVPQTIIVPKGKPEVLAAVNRFIDDVRASGFLQSAIAASGIVGIEAAPAGLVAADRCRTDQSNVLLRNFGVRDHLLPLRDLRGDHRAHLLGRARAHVHADLAQPLLDLRIGEPRPQRRIEARHDRRRRRLGRRQAEPGADVVARRRSRRSA